MDPRHREAQSQMHKRLPERFWPWRRRVDSATPNTRESARSEWLSELDQTDRRLAEEAGRKQLLETLVAGLAHRVNNGLHGVLAHAECAARTTNAASASQGVVSSVQQLADLTRDLASAACTVSVQASVHNLTDLVNQCAASLEKSCPPGMQLTLQSPAKPVLVAVDPQRLREALLQLVRNAAEAYTTQHGLIALRFGTVTGDRQLLRDALPLSSARAGAFGYVEVEDHGSGIDAEHLPRVFEPFFSTKFIGRGLGLPIALNLVRCMNGLLALDSIKGVGTRVRLLFPVAVDGTWEPRSEPSGTIKNERYGAPAGRGPSIA